MNAGWCLVAAAGITAAQAQAPTPGIAPVESALRGIEIRMDAAPSGPGASKLGITLQSGTQRYRLEVMQRGDVAEALAAQKARTGWKGEYLFVRDDCLSPADAPRPWRCVLERVFALFDAADAASRRLVYIGDVHAGDDCAAEARFGCSLYEDVFTDLYDKLENNPLAPPGESPALLLEMRVRNGEFVVDLDETWGRNQERFNAGVRCLMAAAADRAAACAEGITPRRAYLFNAVLATYTRRAEPLMRNHAFARSALCDGINDETCSEKLRSSALLLAGVRPGERPRARGGVTALAVPAPRAP